MKKQLHAGIVKGLTNRLKKVKTTRGLLALAVLLVLVLAVYLGKQGAVREEEKPVLLVYEDVVAVPDAQSCVDSDWGLDFYTKGVVVSEALTEEDTCSKSKVYTGRLYEEYCTPEGEHARLAYDCPSGVCEDGKCVKGGNTVTGETVTSDFSLGGRGRRYHEDAG